MALYITKTNAAKNSTPGFFGNITIYTGDEPANIRVGNIISDNHSENYKMAGSYTVDNIVSFGVQNNVEYLAIVGHNFRLLTEVAIYDGDLATGTEIKRIKIDSVYDLSLNKIRESDNLFFRFTKRNFTDLRVYFFALNSSGRDRVFSQIAFGELMKVKSVQGGFDDLEINKQFKSKTVVDKFGMPTVGTSRKNNLKINISLPNELEEDVYGEWRDFQMNNNLRNFFISTRENTCLTCFNSFLKFNANNSTRKLVSVNIMADVALNDLSI